MYQEGNTTYQTVFGCSLQPTHAPRAYYNGHIRLFEEMLNLLVLWYDFLYLMHLRPASLYWMQVGNLYHFHKHMLHLLFCNYDYKRRPVPKRMLF